MTMCILQENCSSPATRKRGKALIQVSCHIRPKLMLKGSIWGVNAILQQTLTFLHITTDDDAAFHTSKIYPPRLIPLALQDSISLMGFMGLEHICKEWTYQWWIGTKSTTKVAHLLISSTSSASHLGLHQFKRVGLTEFSEYQWRK